MDEIPPQAPGYYGVLGVPAKALPRQIELAFLGWGDRLAAGTACVEAFRRAECAYHVLADPESRARHDRQLGLLTHPAWKTVSNSTTRVSVRRALRELGRGRAERARRLLVQAVSCDPDDPHARSYLALALIRTGGCPHEAAAHARYAIGRRPRESAFHFNLAEVYAAAGLRARALATRARGWQILAASLLGRRPV